MWFASCASNRLIGQEPAQSVTRQIFRYSQSARLARPEKGLHAASLRMPPQSNVGHVSSSHLRQTVSQATKGKRGGLLQERALPVFS